MSLSFVTRDAETPRNCTHKQRTALSFTTLEGNNMSLQDKLDAFKANFETNIAPREVVALIHQTTNDLIASGQARNALKAGDRAPNFTLNDTDNKVVRLSDLLANGPVVLTFYRGVWCPYCNIDLQALQEAASEITALGAQLVAISPQNAANSSKAKKDHGLGFPILSDHANAIADAFGLRFRLPDSLIALYKGFGIDLPATNNDDSWTLPMPARYIIAPDGSIAYAEVNPDYTRRPDPSELMPVLARLQQSHAA